MTEPVGETTAPRGKSLVGFYIAMGVAAALVGLGAWLAPTARLHYRAWQYRRTNAPEHFSFVVNAAIERRMTKEAVIALLGRPTWEKLEEKPPHLVYNTSWSMPDLYHQPPMDEMPVSQYRHLILKNGRVVGIEPPGYMYVGVGVNERVWWDPEKSTVLVWWASYDEKEDRACADQIAAIRRALNEANILFGEHGQPSTSCVGIFVLKPDLEKARAACGEAVPKLTPKLSWGGGS